MGITISNGSLQWELQLAMGISNTPNNLGVLIADVILEYLENKSEITYTFK